MKGKASTSGSKSDRRIAKGDGFHLESHAASPDQVAVARELRQRILAMAAPGLLEGVIADMMLDGNADAAIISALRAAIASVPTIRLRVERAAELVFD